MISNRQMKRTLMIELFSTTGLFLSAMAENLQQLAAGMAAAALYAAYFLWIGRDYDIAKTGKIRKKVYSIRFFLYACFLGNLIKLLVSKMLLEGSSGWYVFLPVFLLTIYANHGGREKRARILEALFWFVFLPLFLVLILAAKEVHIPYLVMGGFKAEKSIRVFLCFCTLEILLFFHGKAKEKIPPLIFVFFLNLLIFVVTVGMYGSGIAQNAELPVVTIIQMVRLPGGFLERLDIFILSFWILSLFAVFSAYCFYGTYGWHSKTSKSLPGQKNIPWVSLLFYAGLYVVVIWNRWDLKALTDVFQTYVLWIDLPLAVILPLLGRPGMKRSIAATLFAALLFIVTGCGPERINIEDRAYVLALGVEREADVWKIDFFLPENECIEAEGENWDKVAENFQKSSEKEMELGHLKAIVIKSRTDVSELESEWKEQDYPKTVLLFETQDSMEDLQKADKNTEDSLGTNLVDLAERNKKQTTLGDYLAGIREMPELRIRTDLLTME